MQSALSKTGTMSLGLSLTIVMERCQPYRWSRGNREHLLESVFSLEVGGGGGGLGGAGCSYIMSVFTPVSSSFANLLE